MFQEYFNNIQREYLESKESSEQTFRTYFQNLITEFLKHNVRKNLFVKHEPLDTEGWGRPDFKIKTNNQLTIGLIETKKIGEDLKAILKSKQLKKYNQLSENIIITNYLDFWLVRNEEVVFKSWICQDFELEKKNYKVLNTRIQELTNLFTLFFEAEPFPIVKSQELAEKLAFKAILLRESCYDIVSNENLHTRLHAMMQAFQITLLPDITAKLFSDIYAQTVTYSLYLAGLNCDSTEKQLNKESIFHYLPESLPLIKEIFHQLEGFPENIKWSIDEIINILKVTDYNSIHQEFSEYKNKDKGFSDPYIYFYEDFLYHYDKAQRKIRGVYYTPEPVVSFITNSIQNILEDDFGIFDGFFGEEVTVLDFACGTGTFLLNVFNLAIDKAKRFGDKELVRKMVNEQMLKKYYGFELLVAPYVVSHLKISEYLKLSGYELDTQSRLRIYLTNTLINKELQPFDFLPSLTEEGKQASKIKNEDILVILGNPPYSGHSANTGEWIQDTIKDYYFVDGKKLNERNPKWLQDDYVKFLRFAQWKMDRVDKGVVGVITNHSYLDNPTFRGMRQSLMKTFDEIYILDLHGNSKKKEKCPDGSKDENIFDIQQGVAIALFVKNGSNKKSIFHSDLWGVRKEKYETLWTLKKNKVKWKKIRPTSPFYLFKPRNEKLLKQYNQGWSLPEIFKKSSVGIVTARDNFVIDIDIEKLKRRISDFIDTNNSDEYLKHFYKLRESSKFKISDARKNILQLKRNEYYKRFSKINYRPFDTRYIFYDDYLIERTRKDVMLNIQEENVALVANRQVILEEFNHCFLTNHIIESCYISNNTKEINYTYPLYILSNGEEKLFFGVKEPEIDYAQSNKTKHGLAKIENFTKDFRNYVDTKYKTHLTPEQIMGYIYAVLHSPTFREKYIEFLKLDFPRIPFIDDKELLLKLSDIGNDLMEHHLMRKIPNFDYCKFKSSDNEVTKVDFKDGKVFINDNAYFTKVPEKIWNFYIGGYKVLDKWLKERKKHNIILNSDDIRHFINVVYIVDYTLQTMKKINELSNKIL